MPLYEFRCPDGHDFEKFYRSIGAAPSEEMCPECGAIAARRMSAAGLVFKGSGFYITDYGKDGKKAEREAAAAKPAGGDSSDGAKKSDDSSKPAADAPAAKPADNAPAAPAASKAETKPAAPAPKTTAPAKKTE